jgi:hypothetical protein
MNLAAEKTGLLLHSHSPLEQMFHSTKQAAAIRIIAVRGNLLRNLVVGLLLGGGLCMAQAQTTNIDWFKVAGGGGTSTGGTYQISGTIGQHDAGGPMTGGIYSEYSLTGGFWSIYALQTPGGPILTMTSGSNKVVISWPLSATNFVLMTNANLTTTNWGTNTSYPVTISGDISITITSPPPGNLFFRLKD